MHEIISETVCFPQACCSETINNSEENLNISVQTNLLIPKHPAEPEKKKPVILNTKEKTKGKFHYDAKYHQVNILLSMFVI